MVQDLPLSVVETVEVCLMLDDKGSSSSMMCTKNIYLLSGKCKWEISKPAIRIIDSAMHYL